MKDSLVFAAVLIVATTLLVSACAQTSATPVPTTVAPVPTKAAQPTPATASQATASTQPQTAQSSAAPAKKDGYPGGKPITLLVGFAAGGATDVTARLLASPLEKELGTSVSVVNKAGASSQVAMTEVARSKPDCSTLGQAVFPSILTTYLDPAHQAAYNLKSFQPVAAYCVSDITLVTRAGSPYKSLKDVVDAAKAQPGKLSLGTSGLLSSGDMTALLFQQVAGVKFAMVRFAGAGETMPALLGGHVDLAAVIMPDALALSKSGSVTILATTESGSNRFLPEIKSFEDQGYKFILTSNVGVVAPAGTPKDIVDSLSSAIKKAVASEEFTTGAKKRGVTPDYLDTDQFTAYWAKNEGVIGSLLQTINSGN